MFKSGDTVVIKVKCSGNQVGDKITLQQRGTRLYAGTCSCEDYWELLNKSNIIMDLKEKFILSFAKEPNKSFRKTGITNGDDILTEDGQEVFLSYLLHNKYAEDFKKDVVDGMLADMEKESK